MSVTLPKYLMVQDNIVGVDFAALKADGLQSFSELKEDVQDNLLAFMDNLLEETNQGKNTMFLAVSVHDALAPIRALRSAQANADAAAAASAAQATAAPESS